MSARSTLPPGAVDGSRIARPPTCPVWREVSSARNCVSKLVSWRIAYSPRRPYPSAEWHACGRASGPDHRAERSRLGPAARRRARARGLAHADPGLRSSRRRACRGRVVPGGPSDPRRVPGQARAAVHPRQRGRRRGAFGARRVRARARGPRGRLLPARRVRRGGGRTRVPRVPAPRRPRLGPGRRARPDVPPGPRLADAAWAARAGGVRFLDSLRSLKQDGRLVVVGFTGGSIPEVKVNRLLLNNTEVVGAGWGAYVMGKPDVNRSIGEAIDRLVREGFVRPIVGERFPLERAAEALKAIDERRATGKVVLEVNARPTS